MAKKPPDDGSAPGYYLPKPEGSDFEGWVDGPDGPHYVGDPPVFPEPDQATKDRIDKEIADAVAAVEAEDAAKK